MLSLTHLYAYYEPFDSDYLSPIALARAIDLAQTAVARDLHLPLAHAQLGWVLVWNRRHDDAIVAFERAFALNRNFIDNRFGFVLTFGGQPARAIEVVEANARLDPNGLITHSSGAIGHAYYMLKRYGDAVRLFREVASRLPNWQWSHLFLACAYAQSGQLNEARGEAAEVLRINPGFTLERWKRLAVYRNPKDVEHHLDGLRKAGLPES
jgi:tetratricopeptide (TPR) repeat protein